MVRWNTSSWEIRAFQEADIRSAACSSDGDLHVYASVSDEGSLRVWNADSHFATESLSANDRLWQVACSPARSEIASTSSSGEIDIYFLDSRTLRHTLRGHDGEVNCVPYSPDCKLLMSGCDDNNIRLWDATAGLELRKFEGHTEWESAISFLLDRKQIISSSYDGTIRRWDQRRNCARQGIAYTTRQTSDYVHITEGKVISFRRIGP